MVRVRRPDRSHFHNSHHAAIFVRQNVTVDNILPRIIDEPAAHLEITGHADDNFYRLARFRIDYRLLRGRVNLILFGGDLLTGWDWENIPPNVVLVYELRTAGFPG